MTELQAALLEHISKAGPITFAAFQETALYDPEHGYYAAGRERSGRRGDFVTSAEIDPAFGALWAVGFGRIWESLGSPGEFEVIEIGPGEGGFAHSVLEAATGDFGDALTLRLVEPIPSLAERQMSRLSGFPNVVWSSMLEELEPAPFGCAFANEVLDNLPVHLVEMRGRAVAELYVGAERGRLVLVPGPPANPRLVEIVEGAGLEFSDGHRLEIGLAALDFLRTAAGAIARGCVVAVDYGVTWAELAGRPSGTLAGYSARGADDLVLDRPGHKDVTSHANWDLARRALEAAGCAVAGPTPQRDVLLGLGLGDLSEELGRRHRDAAAAGRGTEALRALSRHQALSVLADRDGLGGLGVLCGTKDCPQPGFMSSPS